MYQFAEVPIHILLVESQVYEHYDNVLFLLEVAIYSD